MEQEGVRLQRSDVSKGEKSSVINSLTEMNDISSPLQFLLLLPLETFVYLREISANRYGSDLYKSGLEQQHCHTAR